MNYRSVGQISLVLLVLFGTDLVCSYAQNPATPSTSDPDIRKPSSPSVVLDVLVTGPNNKSVKGLRRQDFTLLENGDAQQITAFEVHDHQLTAQRPERPKLPQNTFTNARGSGLGSINIILLDQTQTEIADQEWARVKLIQFFRNKPAGARFAIFTLRGGDLYCRACESLRMVQGITGSKERLLAALNSRNAQPKPQAWQQVFVGGDTTMTALAEIGDILKDIPGRKSLIWMSGAFDSAPVAHKSDIWFPPKFKGWQEFDPFSRTQVLHLAAGRLALAQVALYAIDLTGKNKYAKIPEVCLGTNPDRSTFTYSCEMPGPNIDKVMEQAGGRAFHDPDRIQDQLNQIVDEGAHYYSLTYTTTHQKSDGKIRSIEVRVKQPDWHLSYRRKYFADDPCKLDRPNDTQSPDVVLPNARGPVPWQVMRVSGLDSAKPNRRTELLLAALRYGTPPARGLVFTTNIAVEQKPIMATPEQMAQIKNFRSFLSERIETVVAATKKKKSVATIESLPPPEPVPIQWYSINYSIDSDQLTLTPTDDGKSVADLDIAMLAFDENGRRLAGYGEMIHLTIASESTTLQASGYQHQQTVFVPAHAAVLRFAVRDATSGRTGSVEVPVWAIHNPYERKRLQFPAEFDEPRQDKE